MGVSFKKIELNKFISKTLSEGMLGIKTLKASNAQNWLFSKFDDNTFRYLEVQNETLKEKLDSRYLRIYSICLYLFG